MASITITIPDGVAARVNDAISAEYGYDYNKLNGETKVQFAKRMLIEDWAIRIAVKQEGSIAGAAAKSAAEAQARIDFNIT